MLEFKSLQATQVSTLAFHVSLRFGSGLGEERGGRESSDYGHELAVMCSRRYTYLEMDSKNVWQAFYTSIPSGLLGGLAFLTPILALVRFNILRIETFLEG